MKGILRIVLALAVFAAGSGAGALVMHNRAESWKRGQEAIWAKDMEQLRQTNDDTHALTVKLMDDLQAARAEIARLKGEAP